MEKEIMLRAGHICKTFGATRAVRDVSFDLNKGEIRALIGENGSGKSTFVSMLCGIHTIDSGTFWLDGREIAPKNQVDANRLGVSVIVQEMGTLSGLTVAENIFLGNEDRFVRCGIKNTAAMNREATALLEKYGFTHIKASAMVDNYDFETRKLVELVKATYFDAKIFCVDETTTALSQNGRDELYKQMERIKALGHTVIFISHDLQEVLDKSDTITIFRDGAYIDTIESAGVTEDDLKRMMVGREMDNRYYRTDYGAPISEEVVLSAKDVSVPRQIHNISLELHRGEILGIGGLSESGMHELGKAIFGASYGRTGEVSLASGVAIDSIPTAIRHSVAYASKDRDNESLVINQSIKDNICLPSLQDLSRGPLLLGRPQTEFANRNARQMSVKMENVEQFVSNLSGGNKQKVVLARWIGKDSDILILDSPTRGIDIKVKADIYALMEQFKEQGKSIIMISEEIMELIGMSDRILIFKDGRINGEYLRSPDLSEELLIQAMV